SGRRGAGHPPAQPPPRRRGLHRTGIPPDPSARCRGRRARRRGRHRQRDELLTYAAASRSSRRSSRCSTTSTRSTSPTGGCAAAGTSRPRPRSTWSPSRSTRAPGARCGPCASPAGVCCLRSRRTRASPRAPSTPGASRLPASPASGAAWVADERSSRWTATTSGCATAAPASSPASSPRPTARRCSWRPWSPGGRGPGEHESPAASEDGRFLLSVTIITREADGELADIHERTPVMLPRDRLDAWLDTGMDDPQAAQRWILDDSNLLEDTALSVREVDPAVGKVGNDGPQLLEPPQRLL